MSPSRLRFFGHFFRQVYCRRQHLAVTILLVFLVLPLSVEALDSSRTLLQYNCRTWRRPNGLPTNAITAITQTSDGHIWLGSSKGLVKFDGVEFRVVDLQAEGGSGAKIVTSIARRSRGGLWIGLERGGLGFYSGENYVPTPQAAIGGAYVTTRTLLEGRDGALLVGTVTGAARCTETQSLESLVADLDVLSMHEEANGRLWLGTANNGLKYWEHGKLMAFPEPPEMKWKDWVIHSVAVDRAGLIWVGTSNGLECFNPDFSHKIIAGLPRLARTLLLDSQGVLWIGTIGDGLMRYHNGVLSVIREVDGLASNHILSLAESADGSLWVGTEDGLSQLSDVKFPTYSEADGLSSPICLAVAASPTGGIWAGTSNGLTRIKDGKFTSFGYNKANRFHSRWIKRIFAARNGDVYLLGGQKSVSRFVENEVVKTWTPEVWPRAVAEDSQGILVSLGNEVMRITNDQIVPFVLANGRKASTGTGIGYINEFIVARDDSLWIASENGVAQIKEGIWHDWTEAQKLSDKTFFFLCEDDGGAIWAARNSGLARIKDGKMSFIDHRQGLHEDFVYAIVADQAGNFWMDSNKGIFRVSQAELNAVADGRADRVTCTVYEGQHAVKTTDKSAQEYSGCRSLDGRIWFPSSKGVIAIDPTHVPTNAKTPEIYLKNILVNGDRYSPDQKPTLRPGPGNLEFDYYALDYQAPDRVLYRYRLEGFQNDWVEAGVRRSAYYTNLKPGSYRFHVQACNADGVWNTVGASITLELPPHYYETVWFRLLVAGGLLGVGALVWLGWERRRNRELQSLRSREELQRQLIESSPVAMMLLDKHERIHHFNATFTRLLGYTTADVPDLATWWRVACPESELRASLVTEWAQRIRSGPLSSQPSEPLEISLHAKDGSTRTLLLTSAEVGERTLVVLSDITERKHAEESRQNLEAQLRQSQKMEAVGRLSGGIAHDFNNLLTVILGNISMLELEGDFSPSVRDTLAEIKDSSRRAAKLTQQMLAFSRKQPMTLVVLDLNQLVAEMARMLRRILGEDVGMILKTGTLPVTIRADYSMIEQVLLNLVVNSRDAMPAGGRLVIETGQTKISADNPPPVAPAKPGQFAWLSVTDTGAGISPDVLPRIFEPFYTTKDVGKGTGLGLATVYGIIEQHGGWIEVTSTVGQGTTFLIHLPLHNGEAAKQGSHPGLAPESQADNRLVLLVEDEESVRNFVRRVLSTKGFRVLEAANGPGALALWALHRTEIDVVLTDLVMPDGLSGIELGRKLIGGKPELRIIYTSGYSVDLAGLDFPVREGMNFLPKPFVMDDLLRIVR